MLLNIDKLTKPSSRKMSVCHFPFKPTNTLQLISERISVIRKLLNQVFQEVKLSHRKFYGCNDELVDRYGRSVLQMITDICSTLK